MKTQKDYYFLMSKSLLTEGTWKLADSSVKAIIIILYFHANKEGICYPSAERISKLCGIHVNTVLNNIPKLMELEGFSYKPSSESNSKFNFVYQVPPIVEGEGLNVRINNNLITGPWKYLPVLEQFVYFALRAKAITDQRRILFDMESNEIDAVDAYLYRASDLVMKINKKELMEECGLTRRVANKVLDGLEKNGLIKNVYGNDGKLVYVRIMIRRDKEGEYDDYEDVESYDESDYEKKECLDDYVW